MDSKLGGRSFRRVSYRLFRTLLSSSWWMIWALGLVWSRHISPWRLAHFHISTSDFSRPHAKGEIPPGQPHRPMNAAPSYRVSEALRSLLYDTRLQTFPFISWGRGVKYLANLENARSVLRFHCPSALCIGGDFDLSEALAGVVAVRRTKLAGELRCRGFRRQLTGELVPCQAALHYKLTVAYQARQLTRKVEAYLTS